MLKHLSIKDFVIVAQVELDLTSGFTVLTGETGAGKSILIDALALALGERGDADQVRQGCERAEISAEFDIQALPDLLGWLQENELEGDAGTCLLRRSIDAKGRSRGFINGHTATLQQLKWAGAQLIAVHGQHAHQSLLQNELQRDLLDGFADCFLLAESVKQAYQEWQKIYRQRIEWAQRKTEAEREQEQLEWQVRELGALNLSVEVWQTLQDDHSRLSHVASLLEVAQMSLNCLSEQEVSAISQTNLALRQLQNLLEHDTRLKTIIDLLDSAQVQLQEAVYELKHYYRNLDLDPQNLQEIEHKITAVHAAARKYHVDPEALPDLLQEATEKLKVSNHLADEQEMLKNEKNAHKKYLQLADELSQIRQKAGEELTQKVSAAMQTMAMSGGKFSVALHPLEQASIHGLEQVEFQVAAHKGQILKPINKVASGGELSRISLAIQVITSTVKTVPTLIFDEVDAGIGGRVAEIVGNLLKALGKTHQVMCITHLPQVASSGDQQWQVMKFTDPDNKQTLSQITLLNGKERIEEIARMLGGVKLTKTAREHAIEMLQRGQNE